MANHDPKIQQLVEFNKRKTELTQKKVEQAIKDLIKNKQSINFNSVSKTSGVSKSFLYSNSGLKDRITYLREQEKGLPSRKKVKNNMSDKSKDVIIESLKQKITKLERENSELKQLIQANLMEQYKQI